jgi:GxxExxY protein
MPDFGSFSGRVIGACIEVHRHLGPGLLERVYEACLAHELDRQGIAFQRQPVLPLTYKGLEIPRAYQPDLLVGDSLVVELKAVTEILSVHRAQLRTYVRLSKAKAGLLVNFNVTSLREGIRRVDP